MPGRLVAAAFEPHLGHDDAMVVVGYADRGMDMPAMCSAVMAKVNQLGADRPAAVRRFHGWTVRFAFPGSPRRRGLHSGGSGPRPGHRPEQRRRCSDPRWLLRLAGCYRGGPIGSVVWAATSMLERRASAEKDSDPRLIEASRRAERWVGMPAVASQAHFIARGTPPALSSPHGLVTRATYLHGRDAGDDPLINVGRAVGGWRWLFPDLRVRTIPGRAGRWHLPW